MLHVLIAKYICRIFHLFYVVINNFSYSLQTIVTLLSVMLVLLVATAAALCVCLTIAHRRSLTHGCRIVGVYNLRSVSSTAETTMNDASSTMALARKHVADIGTSSHTLLRRAEPMVQCLSKLTGPKHGAVHKQRSFCENVEQYVDSSHTIMRKGEASVDAVYALLHQLNSTNIGTWSSLGPDELTHRWDATLETVAAVIQQVDKALHARITLG